MTSTPPPPPPIRKLQTKTRPPAPRPVAKKASPHRRPRPAPTKKSSAGRPNRPVRKELSAGGVVAREERGQWYVALLQTEHKRGHVWVLPKGHVEPHTGETIAEAARREVEEEAGVTDLSLKGQLGITKFQFQAETALVRKTVHYYLMTTNQKKLVPQAEEGFVDSQWFPLDVAIDSLAYDTDQDIVRKAKAKLTGVHVPLSSRSRQRSRRSRIKIRT